jgi:glutaredoxin 2
MVIHLVKIVDLNNTANVLYYIKPKNKVYQDFYNNLSDLASFLLNKNENTGEFTSEFVYPSITDDGTLITLKEVLSFPVLDDLTLICLVVILIYTQRH